MQNVLNRILVLAAVLVAWIAAEAQESQTAYNFLRLPVSAHAAAVGGDNVSIIDDDASLMFHNPALLSSVSDRTIVLNFMTYMAGSVTASASYSQAAGSRASWAASGQFINYGSMKQTTADNVQMGTFSAKDIAVAGYFAYMLNNRIAGGVAARYVTSYIGDYSSMAVGIDLGLNYYDPTREWSVSLVAKNLGGQIKAYNDDYDPMPIDIQAGVSKRFAHTPFRVSATLVDLNHWNYRFMNHVVLGVDATIAQSVWLGFGYNFRRADEMKISSADGEGTHAAGLSVGAGLSLERFKVNLAYGKYHVSSSSLMVNLAYSL